MGSEQARGRARSWWWKAAVAVGFAGWVAALLTTPPSALIASVIVFSAFALLVRTGVQTTRENRGRADGAGTAEWRRVVDHTVVGTMGAVAALGLLQVSVRVTLLVGVVLAVTAAWAFSWRGFPVGDPSSNGTSMARRNGEPVPSPASGTTGPETVAGSASELGPLTPAPDLKAMTTTEIVLAWRRSYSQLARVRSPHQLATLAARRQQLLDELEQRDASGVQRWLRSGARAASDPSRFLQRPTGPSATSA